jgi:hypothetical protein
MHPRFIKGITVRFGSQVVKARVVSYAIDQKAVFLGLEEPLVEAKPLEFDSGREGPYMVVAHWLRDSEWKTSIRRASTTVTLTESGDKFLPGGWLIVDKKGTPVGVCITGRRSVSESWKGSPLKWPARSAEEMEELLKELKERADKAVLRVALHFRSPKKSAGRVSRYGFGGDGGESTERNVAGVLMDENTIMVLANLKPKVTGRLERITVHPAVGDPVEAKFTHTLADYGCFLAKLTKPLRGAVKLSTKDIRSLRNRMLLSAKVILQGEKRVTYFWHRRISGCELGWKRRVYPEIGGRTDDLFLFDDEGALVVFPLARRPKVSTADRGDSGGVVATAGRQLKEVLGDLAKNVDPSNVPLAEGEENRLAWLGVELQPLNKELARVNNVSHLTRDGQIGAIVSYVYPGSPANKAGVEATWILLNLQVEGHPKPVDIEAEEYSVGAKYPWDRWDQLPPRYWDGRFPPPWQPVENKFNRTLTDLGFGKKFTATFFAEGKQIKRRFVVAPSPEHYDTAARFKSKALGLTVREMTYEVRRYFRKTPKDPGVIVSAVEPGSSGGVGGVRPYEIVTHVNDKPVLGIKVFEELIKGRDELRLAVLRMTRGRLVKIKTASPATKPASGPSTKPAGKPVTVPAGRTPDTQATGN